MTEQAKGFTLVEIVIVIAILGIAAAVAAPNLASMMARHQLKGAARQVMGDLMWARMQSVSQKNEFKIFSMNSHEYKILDDDDNDGKVDDGEWNRRRDIREAYPDVSMSFSANPIFFPRGSASTGTITLMNRSGAKKVKIHLTGRVKVG
jgi:type IV fimbrial biogenesis protein FimT